MNPILQTERLLLRPFTTDDTEFIIELVNTPGWIKNIGDRNIKSEEQARAYLVNGPIKSYELNGFGLCLVELKNNKTPIGMCGIFKRETLENPEIGFAFLPAFTGKGYAFEIANATITFARETLKLLTILAITIPANKSSINLLEKVGLTFSKTFSFPNTEQELMLFST